MIIRFQKTTYIQHIIQAITMYLLLTVVTCAKQKSSDTNSDLAAWKEEILNTEESFRKMAKEHGLSEAFSHYAAPEAVLLRNDKLVVGKDAIAKMYRKFMTDYSDVNLSWKPEYIDVAASGDMAYTYGQYNLTYQDSLGQIKSFEGIFHTVWKRQPNGHWRFVWD